MEARVKLLRPTGDRPERLGAVSHSAESRIRARKARIEEDRRDSSLATGNPAESAGSRLRSGSEGAALGSGGTVARYPLVAAWDISRGGAGAAVFLTPHVAIALNSRAAGAEVKARILCGLSQPRMGVVGNARANDSTCFRRVDSMF
jgi:hypothetical protein